MKIIKQTLTTLSKHLLRATLSIVGIIFGVAAVISMLSIGEGAKHEVLSMIEQLGKNNLIIRYSKPSGAKGLVNPEGITKGDLALIAENFETGAVAASKNISCVIHEKNEGVKVEVLAVTPSYQSIRNLDLLQGRFLCDLDCMKKNLVCVLGYEVAKSLGIFGNEERWVNINHRLLKVAGVLVPREVQKKNVPLSVRDYNQAVLIPLGVEESLASGSQGIDEVTVQLADSRQSGPYSAGIRSLLMRRHRGVEDFQIVIPQELIRQEQHAQKTFSTILAAIAVLSLLIGGVGIVNIMLAMVTERTQEIGIRRAVGANKTHIMVQFLMEAVILTSIGTGLGLLLGIAAALLMSYFGDWNIVITLWSVLIAVGMSTLAGLLSGLYPAYVAANMDPITALRLNG